MINELVFFVKRIGGYNYVMPLSVLMKTWQADQLTAPNFAVWRTTPARPADLRPFPTSLPHLLVEALNAHGIFSLYSHQVELLKHARAGENVIITTATASGKTLAFNLPVFETMLRENGDSPRPRERGRNPVQSPFSGHVRTLQSQAH